ncbi:MAG TPA: GNAT family N-acetyltransferase [Solirubrobacteraceae bacterium]
MSARISEVSVRDAREQDIPVLLEMLTEFAAYEHLSAELHATAEGLRRGLFGEDATAAALIAEREDQVAGYAIYFATFSTFLASSGVWLEDLYVRPAHRRHGVGRGLLAAVAAQLSQGDGGRLEFSALDWNGPALAFYRGLGAAPLREWVIHRVQGQALSDLAASPR